MDIPKSFKPTQNLDKKTEEYVQGKIVSRIIKREIIVDISNPSVLERDDIYVRVLPPKELDYYRLTLESNHEISIPDQYATSNWGLKHKTRCTSFLNTKKEVLHYLELLQEENNAIFFWQPDKYILKLKQAFENGRTKKL